MGSPQASFQHPPLIGSIADQIQRVRAGRAVPVLRYPPAGTVACTLCGTWASRLDPTVADWARSPVEGSEWRAHRVCTECQAGLVEPDVVVVDDWGTAMQHGGDCVHGAEAYASQFIGASNLFLVYPPSAHHGRLALPDHRTDSGGVVHVGREALVYKIVRI